MANSNLAQCEQYLKSIVTTLKEIGLLHQQMHDGLTETKLETQEIVNFLNISWSKVIKLFVVVDGLRDHLQDNQ